jgi:heme exporter protein D
LISTFLPSGFIVVVSWVSFWISPDAVPGRVTLGVTTVLTMITQSFITGFTLPQVPYVKATDVWMAASMTFVFAALIEFALVNVMQRREIIRKNQALQRESSTSITKIKVGQLLYCLQFFTSMLPTHDSS